MAASTRGPSTVVRLSRVRSRTRRLLIDAALTLFGRKSMDVPAIHEIAAQAGVGTGTFYNYFRTREQLLEAAIVERSERLQDDIVTSYARVADPAERVAIGCRRFILQATREPMWAAGLLRVWHSAPEVLARMLAPVVADLRAGHRRRRFRYRHERAAIDLVVGSVAAGMRRAADDGSAADPAAVVPLILSGLGIRADEAKAVARRPLPRAVGDAVEPPTRARR